MTSEMDDFTNYDSGFKKHRGPKPSGSEYGFDPNASTKEELVIDPGKLQAKYEVLESMWNKLGQPCDDFKEIEKALILIGNRGEIFIWDEISEKYEYWYNKDDMWAALRDFCPTIHAGIRWPTKANVYVLRNFAIRLKKIDYHMKGYWNEIDLITREAKISVLHKSKFQPKYHADVNRWLVAFGGKSHDKLIDWLASFTMLESSTCMLYICGPKGIGKNLLAESLAQIWGGFADWEDRASDYQSDMGRNPFLWANEDMEKPRRTSIMAAIRRLIAGGNQRINEKQRPAYGMECYYRLLVTANNPKLLKSWANLSSDDVEAVRERVGYFYASGSAKTELEMMASERNIPVRELTKEFASGKIAEHVLWLGQNHKIVGAETRRLLVEGWENEVTDMLEYETSEAFLFANAFKAASAAPICGWLKNVDGEYWINHSTMIEQWDEFSIKEADKVRWKEMKDFVKLLCTDEKRRMRAGGSSSNPVYFHKLDSDRLRKMLLNYGFEIEDVDDFVEVKTPIKANDLKATLDQKRIDRQMAEKAKMDQIIAEFPESVEKNLMIVIASSGIAANEVELLERAIELTSLDEMKQLKPNKVSRSMIRALRKDFLKAYEEKQWNQFVELLEEVKDEQVGWSPEKPVFNQQGSSGGGNGWSCVDF